MTIFICYRREDTIGLTGRIFDRLQKKFGSHSVLMDIDSIPFGVDFRQYIAEAIDRCDVMVAVVGDRWLAQGDGDRRRIDDPGDFVRVELEAAFNRELPVIPILIGNQRMPGEGDLPPTLKCFAYRNALHVDPGRDFHHHVDRLIVAIEALIGKDRTARNPGSEAHLSKPLPDVVKQERSSVLHRTFPPEVELVSGPGEGLVCELTKERLLIGRARDCEFALDDPLVGRYHAQLVKHGDGYALEDLRSPNGTFLNGERVTDRVPLKQGDRIHIGASIIRYHEGKGAR